MGELPLNPDDSGLLDVGDGNRMYWEARGNPSGRPVLIVHGGPGAGRSRSAHKQFDPDLFRVVSFDQRGCGDSVPSAATSQAVRAVAEKVGVDFLDSLEFMVTPLI